MTSPIDTTELLQRLNDTDEQRMAYPAIDDYEHQIDLTATDVLHGWRDDEVNGEVLFADAFANAFRVVVLTGDQEVIRRTGAGEEHWVWQHTGHIAGWTVASYTADGPSEQVDERSKRAASNYGAGRERWFATATEAIGRAEEIASVAGEHCQKVCVVVRGIEVYSGYGAQLRLPHGEEAVAARMGSAGGEGG